MNWVLCKNWKNIRGVISNLIHKNMYYKINFHTLEEVRSKKVRMFQKRLAFYKMKS